MVTDPEIRGHQTAQTKLLGTFFIILSGVVLYLDKIFVYFNITLENNHGWNTTEMYVWTLCQTISPMLIMLGMYLRSYFIALSIPAWCYSLQLYVILDSSITIDKPLTWLYVTGTAILVLFIIQTIKKINERYIERKIEEAKNKIKNAL